MVAFFFLVYFHKSWSFYQKLDIYKYKQLVMDKFEQQDSKGRERFKTFCKRKQWCKHHKDATEQYSHWDTSYFSGTTMVIGEVKERNYESSTYSDWYGEVYKYNELMKIKDKLAAKGKNVRVHYINIFTNDDIIIWDITDITLEGFKMELAKTTLEDNGTTNKAMYRLWKAQAVIWEPIRLKPLPEIEDENYDNDLPF
jgi:hypothetical protein